ncbi:MAG: dihydroorotase family protein, partial [Rhodospirillales bacterium]|nr:dihydroorotase family protein [Rhodospirillales bacterium]
MASLCIHNATLVTAASERRGGVLVGDDGRIEALLDGDGAATAAEVIDAKGKLLFPGFLDAHVHMRDPGFTHKEDFASGTTAAACGGITTVMCMPNSDPAVDSVAGFEVARAAGEGSAFVDFTLQGAIVPGNL